MYVISQISVKAKKSLHIFRGSRKFCQRVSDFDNVFLCFFFSVDEGRDDPNTTISGPTLARQQNAFEMAFLCRTNDGPTFNADLVTL